MAKRIIIAEAHADAPKPLRGAPDGSGYRDMARSESSAQELGRPADGKPTAGVGRVRSSGEAGNDRGAKGLCTKSVSNNGVVTRLPPKRRMTQEQIASIAARHYLTKYPDIAPMTERLARKAAAEPKFRFYRLFWWITHEQTLRCAWERVRANGGAPGVDGKDGITDNLVKTVSDALEARELIKLSVLENSSAEVKEAAQALAAATDATVVCTIGRKLVLYRESEKNKKIFL